MIQRKDARQALRVLHTSDVHLATPESCVALAAVVDTANSLLVDLVLVAGDLFDSSRVGQETVEETLKHLHRLQMPAVILPGNHDQLDTHSVYHRIDLSPLGPSLRLITRLAGEAVAFPELGVVVWGRAMEDHSPRFHPLDGAPSRNGSRWHIGMAHGFHVPTGEVVDRSSPIHAEEIAAMGYDYLALGHVHVFRDVSEGPVRAVYSGAPEGLFPFPGLSPGTGHAALVRLDPARGVSVEGVPLVPADPSRLASPDGTRPR